MKNLKTLILLSVVLGIMSCKNADDIKKREALLNPPTVEIVKAIKPSNIGIVNKVSADDFAKKIKTVTLVDVRTPEEFNEGHIKGAVNINFKKRTFPDYINAIGKDKPVAIYCRSGNRSGKAALIMQSLGFKEIVDLDGGYKAWNASKKISSTSDNKVNKAVQAKLSKTKLTGKAIAGKANQVDVSTFNTLIKENKVTLVDVRTAKEFAEGHIDGAVNVDWKNRHFKKHILHITNAKPMAVYCRSGNRATRAMFAMQALGFSEVYNLKDGFKSWSAANLPIKTLEVKGDKHHLDVENFNNAIVGQVGTLVDIRTPKEYEAFHLPHSKNIDFKDNNFKANFSKLNKEAPVLIYCRSGGRSGRATKVLTEMGYEVYNLDKGIKQWKSKGMKLRGKDIHAKDGGEEGC
ncbi:MAG: rhodanese-like domain-containing protein [Flavobacteriaceae bacterium]